VLLASLAVTAASCASRPGPDAPPALNKFTPDLPKPAAAAPRPPTRGADRPNQRVSVFQVSKKGCTTSVVEGLSRQIIAEGNCMAPGSYSELPALDRVALGDAVFPYLAEPARDALIKAVKSHRGPMKINSMLRTVAQQYLLYRWYQLGRCGISLAALPGTSNHQSGLALDVGNPRRWRPVLKKFGFRWLGKRDRWHFDYVGRGSKREGGLDIEAFQRLWNRNHPDDPIGEDGDFGPSTEQALRRAPAQGFDVGPSCPG
jgi:hypothetical protein